MTNPTDEEFIALGRRALDCHHFEWMSGMRGISGGGKHEGRIVEIGEEWCLRIVGEGASLDGWVFPGVYRGIGAVPDLSDPCTLGGLLSLVRGAWGSAFGNYSESSDEAVVTVEADPGLGNTPPEVRALSEAMGLRVAQFSGSKAEALVAALEAAPPRHPAASAADT